MFFFLPALSVFVQHLALPKTQIAYDGGLICKHPKMVRLIESYLNIICEAKQQQKCVLFSAENGSSIGGAILAKIVAQQQFTK